MGKSFASMPTYPGAPPRKPEPWWVPVIIVGTPLLFTGAFVGSIIWYAHHDDSVRAKMQAAAPFQVGEIIRTRVARLRGIVTYVRCMPGQGCDYIVRFPQASMQEVPIGESEIEKAP